MSIFQRYGRSTVRAFSTINSQPNYKKCIQRKFSRGTLRYPDKIVQEEIPTFANWIGQKNSPKEKLCNVNDTTPVREKIRSLKNKCCNFYPELIEYRRDNKISKLKST